MAHVTHQLLQLSYQDWIIQGGKQTTTLKVRLADRITKSTTEHVHRDEKTNAICTYHEESLCVHVVGTWLINWVTARVGWKQDIPDAVRGAWTGLLHDASKDVCASILKRGEQAFVSFPFHGQAQSGWMLSVWASMDPNQTLPTWSNGTTLLSPSIWEHMAQAVQTHMCGLQQTSSKTPEAKLQLALLSLQRKDVLNLQRILRVGDGLARVSSSSTSTVNLSILESDGWYSTYLQETKTRMDDFGSFDRLYGLIRLCGPPKQGKTTLTNRLTRRLQEWNVPFVVLSRDQVMVDVVNTMFKTKWKFDNPQDYANARRMYDEKRLYAQVNSTLRQQVKQAWLQHKWVVLDTVMNASRESQDILPLALLPFALVLDIHMIRAVPYTNEDAKLLGLSSADQLCSLVKKRSHSHWWLNGMNLRGATTRSESSRMFRADLTQPHLSYLIAWNDKTTFGWDELDHQFSTILPIWNAHMTNTLKTMRFPHGEDMGLEITEWVNRWDKLYGTNGMQDMISACDIEVFKTTQPNLFGVKYKEFCRMWNNLTVHGRGTFFFRETPQTPWTIVKYHMPRGTEVATEDSKTVQDMELGRMDHLDPFSQRLIQQLHSTARWNEPVVFSSKSDGSCLGICLVRKSSKLADAMLAHFKEIQSDFALESVKMVQDMGWDVFPSFASQATITASKDMYGYYMWSLLVATGCMTDRELETTTKTPIEVWKQHGPSVWKAIRVVVTNALSELGLDASKIHTMVLTVECMTKHRIAFGIRHTELAQSYETSLARILSLWVDQRLYPHFAFSKAIHTSGWSEPYYRFVSSGAELSEMASSLTGLVKKQTTLQDWFKRYPSSSPSCSSSSSSSSFAMDYEGCVVWYPRPFLGSENNKSETSNSNTIINPSSSKVKHPIDVTDWCVSKMKEKGFYEVHKPDHLTWDMVERLAVEYKQASDVYDVCQYANSVFLQWKTHLSRLAQSTVSWMQSNPECIASTPDDVLSSLLYKSTTKPTLPTDLLARVVLVKDSATIMKKVDHWAPRVFATSTWIRDLFWSKAVEWMPFLSRTNPACVEEACTLLRQVLFRIKPWSGNEQDVGKAIETYVATKPRELLRLFCLTSR